MRRRGETRGGRGGAGDEGICSTIVKLDADFLRATHGCCLVVELEPAGFGLCEFRCGLATFPCRAQVRCWQHEQHATLMPSIRYTIKLRVHHCTGIIAQMPHAGRQEPTRYRSCCSVPARAPHINGRGVEEACWQRSGEGAAVARSGCLSTSTDKGEGLERDKSWSSI